MVALMLALTSCSRPIPDESQSADSGKAIRLANGLIVTATIRAGAEGWAQPTVRFEVTNRSKEQRWFYVGHAATLVDDRGRTYACTSEDENILKELGSPTDQQRRPPRDFRFGNSPNYPAVLPTSGVEDMTFQAVEPGWRSLTLRVSAARFGSRGTLEYKLERK